MKRRFIRYAVLVTLSSVVLLVAVIFVDPPASVLRLLVRSTSVSLMSGYQPSQGRAAALANRLLKGYVQASFAARFAESSMAAGGRDQQILARMMTSVRQVVLDPPDPVKLRYSAGAWPALVSGVGYCDQVNGAVCLIAARHFERAELFALYSAESHSSPHTIGRVWSSERQGWLYFDAFFAVPVIFERDAKGKPTFLPAEESEDVPARTPAPPGIYELPGWRISEFSGTFAGYLADRLWSQRPAPVIERPESAENVAQPATPVLLDGVLAQTPPPRVVHREDEVYRRVARAYVNARVEHLLEGEPDRAAYLAVASDETADTDDRAAEVAAAAQRFADGH